MEPGQSKGWPWFPRSCTRLEFARRWWDWKERLGHRIKVTPADLARCTGVSWQTARRAIEAGPLAYGRPSLVVDPYTVPLPLPPVAKALWTLLELEAPDGWSRATWWALADKVGRDRRTVGRALAGLVRAGLLEERAEERRGFVLIVARRIAKLAPAESPNWTPRGRHSGTGGIAKLALGEDSTQTVRTPPTTNGVALDLAAPPPWARDHPGGESGTRWAMLGSSLVANQLPAGPLPSSKIQDVLRLAGVRIRRAQLADALAGAGLTADQLLETVRNTGTGAMIRDRSAFFRSSLESFLADE